MGKLNHYFNPAWNSIDDAKASTGEDDDEPDVVRSYLVS